MVKKFVGFSLKIYRSKVMASFVMLWPPAEFPPFLLFRYCTAMSLYFIVTVTLLRMRAEG